MTKENTIIHSRGALSLAVCIHDAVVVVVVEDLFFEMLHVTGLKKERFLNCNPFEACDYFIQMINTFPGNVIYDHCSH